MKNAIIDPVTLIFDLSTSIPYTCTSRVSQDLYEVLTLRDHSFSSYAADKQTDRQTDGPELSTHADQPRIA